MGDLSTNSQRDAKELADGADRTLKAINGYLNYQEDVMVLSHGEDGHFWQEYLNTVNEVTIELIRNELRYYMEDVEFVNDRALRETK